MPQRKVNLNGTCKCHKEEEKMNSNKAHGYCFSCREWLPYDHDISLIKKVTKNGRLVSILCGYCTTCKTKMCKIIANEKAPVKKMY